MQWLVWPSSVCCVEPQRRQRGLRAQTRVLCHNQHRLHCMILVLLGRGWVLVIMPNRDNRTGSLALLSSGKLINQLEEIVLGFAALVVVSATAVGVIPVASVTSAASISGVMGTMEYWLAVSWPIFRGMFVTR